MAKKRYKLHCFRCGSEIYCKEDVYRNSKGYPICGECMVCIAEADYNLVQEEEFYKQFPTDQDYIDYKHKQKYGEY